MQKEYEERAARVGAWKVEARESGLGSGSVSAIGEARTLPGISPSGFGRNG